MNRRDFAMALSGLGAMFALKAPPKEQWPDEFVCHGHRVRWCGWRVPPNQDVKVGFWIAEGVAAPDPLYGSHRTLLVSTTTGDVRHYGELEAFELTFRDTWPKLTARHPVAECAAVKERAAQALVDYLHVA